MKTLGYKFYVNPVADKRIVDHLKPYVEQRRASEEFRRLMNIALDVLEGRRPTPPPKPIKTDGD